MRKSRFIRGAGCLVVGAAFLSIAAPSLAQSEEDIVVTGRYGRVPDSVQSLSQNVSYADLDLSTRAGRDELRHRVSLTARYLCDKLGESDSATPPAPSCRDAAYKDAMDRIGTMEASFAPRGSTWVAGPAWQAPYSSDWAQRYP
ncbi:UrcA family protein [Flavisphingomonas formosensis]|uniref:UrcA family protein n=1 Tax=Flavisphingomonas formosensis TaxID=861534 RepID=UPI0012FC6E16|nr:UrcA family protein [Sphingomonas formosensis]